MVKRKDEKERFEKAMGLVSLTADSAARESGGNSKDCPSPETLAALLDNRCTAEEVTNLKEHLSRCEDCFQQWLTLSSFHLASSRPSVRGSSRRRVYATIGSTLALAATVAVYLNIADYNITPVQQSGSPQVTGEKVSDTSGEHKHSMQPELLREKSEVLQIEEHAQKISKESPRTEPERKTSRPQSVGALSDDATQAFPEPEGRMKAGKIVPDVPGSLEQESSVKPPPTTTSSRPKPKVDKRVVGRNTVEFESWKNQVATLCRFPQTEMGNLPQLIKQGRRLLMHREITGISKQSQRIIPKIVFLLQRLENGYQPQVCKEVFDTLAQENKSR